MYAPRERGVELSTSGPHLFLSHSSKDNAIVSRLAQDLNVCGVDVWLDGWELRVGDDLHERIADAIAKSRFVAVAVSARFDQSKWTKGEVSQALSREKAESRTLVLPLLLENVPLPPVLGSKKYLVFTEDEYYSSLVRLAGLIHGLDTQSVEMAVTNVQPRDMRSAVKALRFADWEPYCIVDTKTLEMIRRAGGTGSGDVVSFDPERILQDGRLSPSVRALVRRLIDEW